MTQISQRRSFWKRSDLFASRFYGGFSFSFFQMNDTDLNDIDLAELELKIAQFEKLLLRYRQQGNFDRAGKVIDILEILERRRTDTIERS